MRGAMSKGEVGWPIFDQARPFPRGRYLINMLELIHATSPNHSLTTPKARPLPRLRQAEWVLPHATYHRLTKLVGNGNLLATLHTPPDT